MIRIRFVFIKRSHNKMIAQSYSEDHNSIKVLKQNFLAGEIRMCLGKLKSD